MIVRTEELDEGGKRLIIECDHCHTIFERPYKKRHIEHKLHFCSADCRWEASKKGGVLDSIKKVEYLKTYGKEHPSQLDLVKDKKRLTCIEKYGVSTNILLPETKRKALEAASSDAAKKKRIETYISNYGVSHPLRSKEIMSRIDWSSIAKKAHKTKRKNGTYKRSKLENKFYNSLCDRFGEDNVVRQVVFLDISFDFYIKSNDTYVHFDSDYFHGRGQSADDLINSERAKDQAILHTMLIDDHCDSICIENGVKFVRIWSSDYMKNPSVCVDCITDVKGVA